MSTHPRDDSAGSGGLVPVLESMVNQSLDASRVAPSLGILFAFGKMVLYPVSWGWDTPTPTLTETKIIDRIPFSGNGASIEKGSRKLDGHRVLGVYGDVCYVDGGGVDIRPDS
jgi:hypothetical protein